MGNVYTNQGDLTNAIQSYEKTIELDPKHAGAYYNLGNVYANQGEDLPKAIQLLQEAARLGLRGNQE
jgi:tetratricopeptide (TPR) repeat protein